MKAEKIEQLPPPPTLEHAERAMEMARVWIVDGHQHVVLSQNLWRDPGSWGLMLVDIARHVASAYAARGDRDRAAVLERIREAFDAEWSHPTGKFD
jgi:hypothetical protein